MQLVKMVGIMGPTTHIFQDQLILFRHFIFVNWLMHTSYL